MVAAYHLVWTAYGCWLPNDPRGSMSRSIRNDVITDLGEIHYGRKPVQPAGGVVGEFYEQAQSLLKHELLKFDDDDLGVVAEAFQNVIRARRYTCYACAIMTDHVHILIRKHRDKAEEMIAHFQEQSETQILLGGRRSADHPVWGGPGWKVFLFSQSDIERTVRYIEQNPIKARRPAQRFEFVTSYDGWLPGVVSREKPKGIAKPQACDERGAGDELRL
jgi:REP element-mobilizing transposase RayT